MMRKIPDRLMPHKNTSYTPCTGTGRNGRTYGPRTSVPRALVVQKTKLVRNSDGEQVVSGTQVYLDALTPIPVNSMYRVNEGNPFMAESVVLAVELYQHPLVGPLLVLNLE